MPAITGGEFIERLRDDRTVYYKGEVIDDVTVHPATREMIATQAELFDLQHDEESREQLTYESPSTSDRVSIFYKRPQSREDLKARRRASTIWQQYTSGVGGRSSDFLAAGITGLAITHDVFDKADQERGSTITDYYEYCRENDMCLSHALIDPQIDRSETSSFRTDDGDSERPGSIRMVEDRSDGMVVSGARMLATLGPQADELLVFPSASTGRMRANRPSHLPSPSRLTAYD
nr:4-hydroxyphenylacetate 3-hydroxylase N-terminal domain-containing protein [Halobellus rufus]